MVKIQEWLGKGFDLGLKRNGNQICTQSVNSAQGIEHMSSSVNSDLNSDNIKEKRKGENEHNTVSVPQYSKHSTFLLTNLSFYMMTTFRESRHLLFLIY